jgi:PAS domain S-box-containing protein
MDDKRKTKAQLLAELAELRHQVAELERSGTASAQAEEMLRENEERLRQIVSSIREVVWLRDTKTLEVLYVNPAYEELWGRSCASLYENPTSFFDAVHPEDKERILQAIQNQYRGVPFSEEYRIVRPDGSLRWVWGRTFPIGNAAGEVYRIAALAEDITARKHAEEALRQFNAELLARNEDSDAFAHTVAHDLKNPLSYIIGFADTLIEYDATFSDEQRLEILHKIVKSGYRLNEIIEELLLLSRVHQTEVTKEPLNTARIVAEVRQRLSHMIEDSHAEISEPSEWPIAIGYEPWVQEVWVNYLTNALKYGGMPSTAPCIELGATTQPDGQVRFWIRDHGIGITAENQSRLFRPFTRLDQARAKGHGLGLSIVKRIVEKMGGQVNVESTGVPGEGSVFGFTLPGAVTQILNSG